MPEVAAFEVSVHGEMLSEWRPLSIGIVRNQGRRLLQLQVHLTLEAVTPRRGGIRQNMCSAWAGLGLRVVLQRWETGPHSSRRSSISMPGSAKNAKKRVWCQLKGNIVLHYWKIIQ